MAQQTQQVLQKSAKAHSANLGLRPGAVDQ
jgi:hypothetical protein